MRSRSKKVRKLKPPLLHVAETMGKWKPSDDYLLIQSILHVEDLGEVHNLTKFSKKFTLKELENRWFAILYDAPISRMIYKNLKKLHSDDILRLKKLIPFNLKENSILLNLDSTITPTKDYFENLLIDYRVCFHEARTAECLMSQYLMLKDLNLLKNQLIEEHEKLQTDSNKSSLTSRLFKSSFEKAENELNDSKSTREAVQTSDSDKALQYNRLENQIKRAEADLFLWQILVDKVSGSNSLFNDNQTVAVFFNEKFTYSMKKREIKIGRSLEADITLNSSTKSGLKISRIQCTVCQLDANKFYLINNGRLPIFVDGKTILTGSQTQSYQF